MELRDIDVLFRISTREADQGEDRLPVTTDRNREEINRSVRSTKWARTVDYDGQGLTTEMGKDSQLRWARGNDDDYDFYSTTSSSQSTSCYVTSSCCFEFDGFDRFDGSMVNDKWKVEDIDAIIVWLNIRKLAWYGQLFNTDRSVQPLDHTHPIREFTTTCYDCAHMDEFMHCFNARFMKFTHLILYWIAVCLSIRECACRFERLQGLVWVSAAVVFVRGAADVVNVEALGVKVVSVVAELDTVLDCSVLVDSRGAVVWVSAAVVFVRGAADVVNVEALGVKVVSVVAELDTVLDCSVLVDSRVAELDTVLDCSVLVDSRGAVVWVSAAVVFVRGAADVVNVEALGVKVVSVVAELDTVLDCSVLVDSRGAVVWVSAAVVFVRGAVADVVNVEALGVKVVSVVAELDTVLDCSVLVDSRGAVVWVSAAVVFVRGAADVVNVEALGGSK
ncbi:hypothetical protein COOONC_23859 [Cooperia oncophora]